MIMCSKSSANPGQRTAVAVKQSRAIQYVSYNIRYAGLRAGLGNWSWLVDKPVGG